MVVAGRASDHNWLPSSSKNLSVSQGENYTTLSREYREYKLHDPYREYREYKLHDPVQRISIESINCTTPYREYKEYKLHDSVQRVLTRQKRQIYFRY